MVLINFNTVKYSFVKAKNISQFEFIFSSKLADIFTLYFIIIIRILIYLINFNTCFLTKSLCLFMRFKEHIDMFSFDTASDIFGYVCFPLICTFDPNLIFLLSTAIVLPCFAFFPEAVLVPHFHCTFCIRSKLLIYIS